MASEDNLMAEAGAGAGAGASSETKIACQLQVTHHGFARRQTNHLNK
jgi:hypothetical protein